MNYNFTTLTFMTLGVAAVALLLWWVVRLKKDRIWFPIVRILKADPKSLPILRLRPPHWLSFICFLLVLAAFLFATTRPYEVQYKDEGKNNNKTLFILDLSPSVSQFQSIEDYANLVGETWENLGKKTNISVLLSSSSKEFYPKSQDELKETIKKAGYHRGGVEISSLVKGFLFNKHKVDQIIIFSDRDEHSWQSLNWKYIDSSIEMHRVDLTRGTKKTNFYIDKVSILSGRGSRTVDWMVNIHRRGAGRHIKSILRMNYKETLLAEVPWEMGADDEKIAIQISLPYADIEKIDKGNNAVEHLRWELGDEDLDSLKLDNIYRSFLVEFKKKVLLLHEKSGERYILDSTYQLETILSVLGYSIKRYDLLDKSLSFSDTNLLISAVNDYQSIDSFCPHLDSMSNYKRIWLIPESIQSGYNNICKCFQRIASFDDMKSCDQVLDRKALLQQLSSYGATQVGGELGQVEQSLAVSSTNNDKGIEVVAFSVPLSPNPQIGMDYKKLPLLIKNLLSVESHDETYSDFKKWPRIDNIANLENKDKDVNLEISNVPVGESLQKQLPAKDLPLLFEDRIKPSEVPFGSKKEEKELPAVYIMLMLLMVSLLAEIVLGGGYRLYKKVFPFLIAAAILSLVAEGRAWAQVGVAIYSDSSEALHLSALARELSQRTSLELSNVSKTVNSKSWNEEPWLWVNSLSKLRTSSGVIKHEVVLWLKKGGLLILQGDYGVSELNSFLAPLKSTSKGSEFNIIPPDHVIMRSFYLLNSLPVCKKKTSWRYVEFDKRTAIVVIPFSFIEFLADERNDSCPGKVSKEDLLRSFVNLTMMALATDYKKDQIHLPEILKRLR